MRNPDKGLVPKLRVEPSTDCCVGTVLPSVLTAAPAATPTRGAAMTAAAAAVVASRRPSSV